MLMHMLVSLMVVPMIVTNAGPKTMKYLLV